jgi:hypothetical protein
MRLIGQGQRAVFTLARPTYSLAALDYSPENKAYW